LTQKNLYLKANGRFSQFGNAPKKNTYSNTLILQRQKYGNEDPEGINELNLFPFLLIFKRDQQFNTIQTALYTSVTEKKGEGIWT